MLDEVAFASFENSVKSGIGSMGIGATWIMTAQVHEPRVRACMDRLNGDLNPTPANRGLEAWKDALAAVSGKAVGQVLPQPSPLREERVSGD
ncbi:MAG TPA: hypothetical protein VGG48_06115 [Rhizomicrobium sp.]